MTSLPDERKRVLLVDRQPLLRRGLAEAVANVPTVRVSGEAGSVPSAVRQLRSSHVDILVLDVGIRGEGGLDLLVPVAAETGVRLLLVASPVTPLPHGLMEHPTVAGAVLRADGVEEAALAIATLAGGGRYVSKGIEGLPGGGALPPVISSRQRVLLQLVAEGLPNSTIATRLSLSVSSINAEMQLVLRALGAVDRTQAVLLALERGLLPTLRARSTHEGQASD